jgi:hypothetical protein
MVNGFRATVSLNYNSGLDAGEAESCVFDGEDKVDQKDDTGYDGQHAHGNTSSTLTCTQILNDIFKNLSPHLRTNSQPGPEYGTRPNNPQGLGLQSEPHHLVVQQCFDI